MINKFKEIKNKYGNIKKINFLENENETLKDIIKNELYEKFISSINDTTERDRLKKENKRLREKIKALKDIIKEKD